MDGVQSVYFTETRIENKMLFLKSSFPPLCFYSLLDSQFIKSFDPLKQAVLASHPLMQLSSDWLLL